MFTGSCAEPSTSGRTWEKSGKIGLPMLSVPIEPAVLINSELEVVRLELSDVGFPPLLLTLVAVGWADAADTDSASAATDAKNTRFIDRPPMTSLHR